MAVLFVDLTSTISSKLLLSSFIWEKTHDCGKSSQTFVILVSIAPKWLENLSCVNAVGITCHICRSKTHI